MGKKSKRGSGPRPGNRRAELLEQRRRERAALDTVSGRPFEGLAAECDLVAMREFVPSASAELKLAEGVSSPRPLAVTTVLPGAVAAIVREQALGAIGDDKAGVGLVGMQVQVSSVDLAADLANSVQWLSGAELGETLMTAESADPAPAVTEVLDPRQLLDITVYNDFAWWIPEGVDPAPEVQMAVQRANEVMLPTARVEADGVEAAWWVDAGEKAHLRWVRPEDEEALMSALARLHSTGGLNLGDGSRFAGSFRTHGLLVPVFDLDRERHPDEWAQPTAALGERLNEVLADDRPLTPEERRSRDGLRSRQITLR